MFPVTIVIPVFNQERFIANAVESALRQTYAQCSVMVVDDGSTDKTPDILRKYQDRITILRQDNAGTSAAWNAAIKCIQSEFVIGLDSDDEFFPHTVAQAVFALQSCPHADLVYSDYEFIDASGMTTKVVQNPDPYDPVKQLAILHDRLGQKDNFLPFGHVRLYRKSKLLEIGGYDSQYLYAEDYDLTLRLAEQEATFVHVPEVLYRYRWHQSNKGVVMRDGQVQDVRKSFECFLERNPNFKNKEQHLD
jgi:glycosyltransferase involved in cell wall biosynthesis